MMTMTDPVTAACAAGLVAGEPCVLLKQGEIFLKGRNRQQFERMLHANLRAAVRGLLRRTTLDNRIASAVSGGRANAAATAPRVVRPFQNIERNSTGKFADAAIASTRPDRNAMF